MATDLIDEADAYLLLERVRWGGAPRSCPHCLTVGRCYFLTPADGSTRATRTGARSQRRVWKCAACRRQFSVLTATVFEGSQVGVLTWLRFLADVVHGCEPETVVARAARCGVTAATARRMSQRLQFSAELETALQSRLRSLTG